MKKGLIAAAIILIVLTIWYLDYEFWSDRSMGSWNYVLSYDEEYYLIKDYEGDKKSIQLEEKYRGKKIIGFHQRFTLPDTVESLTLSKNIETLDLKQYGLSYLTHLSIPKDSKLKGISCDTKLSHLENETFYIPEYANICVDSFIGNNAIQEFIVHKDNPHYRAVDGVLLSRDLNELILYPPKHRFEVYTTPSTVTTIGEYAFYLQSSLKTLNIRETVTQIKDYAFKNSKIEEVIFFPQSTIDHLGKQAFMGANQLKYFDVPDGVFELEGTFYYSSVEEIRFGENSQLTKIGEETFLGTNHLKELILPKNVSTILENALTTNGIEHLTIQSNLIEFDPKIFSGMKNLKTLTFEEEQSNLSFIDGIMTINEGSEVIFYLPEIELPPILKLDEHVAILHEYAFDRTRDMDRIEVDLYNPYLKSIDGVLYSQDLTELILYPYTNSRTTYQIQSGTREMIYPMSSLKYLEEIIIPESLEIIPRFAFAYSPIEEVTFLGESNLEMIPMYAFTNTKLNHITIPKSVESILGYSFVNVPLERIEFEEGSSLNYIGQYVFKGTQLAYIIFPPNDIEIYRYTFETDYLKHVYVPKEMTFLNQNVFSSTQKISIYFEASSIPETMQFSSYFFETFFSQTMDDFLAAIENNG